MFFLGHHDEHVPVFGLLRGSGAVFGPTAVRLEAAGVCSFSTGDQPQGDGFYMVYHE